MKQTLKTALFLAVFVFLGTSLASANFAKKTAEEAKPAAEVQAPIEEKAQTALAPAAETKPAAPAAKAATPKVNAPKAPFSDQPFEIQTPERTMIICHDGYSCGESEGKVKCIPEKNVNTAVDQGGVLCKEIPKNPAPAAPRKK